LNIFYLHEDPRKAAEYQYNKHVVKMILESAQMLCTAHHHFDNGDNVPYKKAHYNHPSTIWVRENSLHYDWLYEHFVALQGEYHRRYGKTHLAFSKCYVPLMSHPENIPHEPFEQPPQCMPDEYKDKCSVKAYWNYYIGDKYRVANSNETIKTKMYERETKTKN